MLFVYLCSQAVLPQSRTTLCIGRLFGSSALEHVFQSRESAKQIRPNRKKVPVRKCSHGDKLEEVLLELNDTTIQKF
jgi:hypothetical protein